MDLSDRSSVIYEKSFLNTLDNACLRLQEKQARYTIKRLDQLDAILDELETELDILVQGSIE